MIETVLLGLELYHLVAHTVICFGLFQLPRKDLVRSHLYTLFDAVSAFLSTLFFARHLWWLCVVQLIQHLYTWYTWDTSTICKKVITWSSLESHKINDGKRFSLHLWDSWLGTFFDIACHVVFSYYVFLHSNFYSVLISLCLFAILLRLVLFNPKFAWSPPGQEPEWVKKRLNSDVKY